MKQPFDETLSYYEANAEAYARSTVGIDMSEHYARFLPSIPVGGAILDAGCGSGRDAKVFRERGYVVTAFDASPAMSAVASRYAGIPVATLRLQDLDFQNEFDGVWASASLLHVPRADLGDVLRRVCRAIRDGGILYASFKLGNGERAEGARRFTDCDERYLNELVLARPELQMLSTWIDTDSRTERDCRWISMLARKLP